MKSQRRLSLHLPQQITSQLRKRTQMAQQDFVSIYKKISKFFVSNILSYSLMIFYKIQLFQQKAQQKLQTEKRTLKFAILSLTKVLLTKLKKFGRLMSLTKNLPN